MVDATQRWLTELQQGPTVGYVSEPPWGVTYVVKNRSVGLTWESMIFESESYTRWRRPWWARVVAWGFAAWFAMRR